MVLECGLKGWHQLPKLIQRETSQIEHLGRTGLEISEPSRSHGGGLLSLEAQDIINRDEPLILHVRLEVIHDSQLCVKSTYSMNVAQFRMIGCRLRSCPNASLLPSGVLP